MNMKKIPAFALTAAILASSVLFGASAEGDLLIAPNPLIAPAPEGAAEIAENVEAEEKPEGVSLSGLLFPSEGKALVTDIGRKVIAELSLTDGSYTVYAGVPLKKYEEGGYTDGKPDEAYFAEPWAIAPFLSGYAVSDAAAGVVRYVTEDLVQTAVKAGVLSRPTGLATGFSGELYIADTTAGKVFSLSNTGVLTEILSGLSEPTGLYFLDGTLFIAETGRNRIIKADLAAETVKVELVAGGDGAPDENGEYAGGYADGLVSKARFDHPQGVCAAGDGAIYVSDTGNGAIRVIRKGRVNTLLAPADETVTPLAPRALCRMGDTLYAADTFASSLITVDLSPKSFRDVAADSWYASYVTDAAERGLTGGVGDGLFAPESPVTRAMLVKFVANTALYGDRTLVINGEKSFPDVAEDNWYASPSRWAADNGIVQGFEDGTFRGDTPITREQFVTILYRYASLIGLDTAKRADITSFDDAPAIADYAADAFSWAVASGIVNGLDDHTLAPKGTATRAQTVKMLIAFSDLGEQ